MKKVLLSSVAIYCFWSLTALAGSLDVVRPELVGMSSERLDRVRIEFQALVDQGESSGYQIVVARRGKVVLHESMGTLNIETGVPVTNDSLFRIFSMTKPIVATAMMILYEEGRFSLSDPITKYIPEFKDLKVYAGLDEAGEMILEDPKRPPQIHDLLQHTAGFTYGIFGDTPVDKLYRDANLLDQTLPLSDMIQKLAGIPLMFQPGEQYLYSVSADIEGYLIEQFSGMDAAQFLQQRILDPLRMNETVTWVPPEHAALLAEVHVTNDEGILAIYSADPDPTRFALEKPARFSGGGQLISTADDYFRFAQMLLNGGELDGVRILAPLTVKMMTSNRLPLAIPDRSIDPGRGHGFHLRVVADPTLVGFPASSGEFGHGGLATTTFWVDPELELVVVLLNQYFPTGNDQMQDLAHRLIHAAIIE